MRCKNIFILFRLSGTGMIESLREKLRSASEMKDKSALQDAIKKSLAAGLPELDSDISQAKKLLKELGDVSKG